MTTEQAQFHLERWQQDKQEAELIASDPSSTEENQAMAQERIEDADYFIRRYQGFLAEASAR